MDQLFERYSKMYKQEIIEDDEENENKINYSLINYNFKLPIEYTNFKSLKQHVRNDIEFTSDNSNNNIYSMLLSNNYNNGDSLLLDKWSSLYTSNENFLKDSQKLLKSYKGIENKMTHFSNHYEQFKNIQNFLSQYQYIQFRRFFYLNTVVAFLQILALYNLFSPLIALLSPFLGLIIPYFIFYWKGIRMSFKQYFEFVKQIILNNNIIKNLLNFNKNTFQDKMYTLVYIFFYGMGIYNNVNSCIHFVKNTKYMIKLNDEYILFLDEGNKLIENIHNKTKSLKYYKQFNDNMLTYQTKLHEMSTKLTILKNQRMHLLKCKNIGLLMKTHFDLYYNEEYNDTILYITYLNQFNQDLHSLAKCYHSGNLNTCKFIKVNSKTKNTKIKNMYYINHMNQNKICNDLKFNKNIMITGPNASGKTTMIKSTIINLFLSQSIGAGCYSSCKLKLYDHFHSYLNIPDTSNRDSLFQAEARRCKDIFEFIKKHHKERHLCIFDEIYSGTNPNDAVLCANIYLTGMNNYKNNVDYVLTTHYLDLCKKFTKDKYVKNQQMQVSIKDNDQMDYTYKLENGISNIHGGLKILKDLEYPTELLKTKQ